MSLDIIEPLEPMLVPRLLEDLLAFGVAVLARTDVGAPERQLISFTQPVDEVCDQIVAYPGTFLPFPDFQRSDKPQPDISPKVKLWLRWTRCMTMPEGPDAPSVDDLTLDAFRLVDDAYRMVTAVGFARKRDTLFERYSIKQVQHVQFLGCEAIPQQSGTAGYQLALEVQLSGFAVRG